MANEPNGLCLCGCGQKAPLAPKNDNYKGWIKGQPLSFIQYHNIRPYQVKGPKSAAWEGDNISENGGRQRANRMYQNIGPCTVCGDPKSERHHKDGNPKNNSPENIQILCPYHHREIDGRLEKFMEWARNYDFRCRREL